jgi:hypothetical protein
MGTWPGRGGNYIPRLRLTEEYSFIFLGIEE